MSDNGRSRVWLWVLIGGGAFFLFVLAVFTLVFLAFHASAGEQSSLFGDKIGVVDLDGVIMSPTETVDQLRKLADDDSIKAIIIHVNSPTVGGEAHIPFGGMKATGVGLREMGRVAIDFYTELKVVYVDYTGSARRGNLY